MEHPIKIDDLGVSPILGNLHVNDTTLEFIKKSPGVTVGMVIIMSKTREMRKNIENMTTTTATTTTTANHTSCTV